MNLHDIRTSVVNSANNAELNKLVDKHCLKVTAVKKLTKHCSNVTFGFIGGASSAFVLKMDHSVLLVGPV
jgi:hypothetical protein